MNIFNYNVLLTITNYFVKSVLKYVLFIHLFMDLFIFYYQITNEKCCLGN